jgi:3'-phosphoadenosine 5'-phosphosulfate (PAPS) 3'-phosphatase
MMSSDKTEETMMKSVLRDLMPLKVNKVKGPGNKFLHLTNERSDFFLNLVPGYSMWDICASEAIFASRGGILTDAKQTPLFYDSSRRSFGLFNGVVAARNADIYLSAKDKYESKSGSTLAQSQT